MILHVGDKCPDCQVGKMILKNGRYGDFLGCDMYRHTGCNFIAKLAPEEAKDSLELQADAILRQHNKEYLII